MNSLYTELQDRHPVLGSQDARDFLWLHIRDLPYFRSLLRAVEAQFYKQVNLQAPTLDLGCGEGHFAE
ncbi:MAG TPA: hypothetical protein VK900_15965, partial [Anaerolineales bacterium]|nr:hypothetical protein [Anaerolineales bacterium]